MKMSLKKKLKKLLSASEHKKEAEQEAHGLQHHAPAEEPQPEAGESMPFQDEALLELPQEHPLYQLTVSTTSAGRRPDICPRPVSAWTRTASSPRS